MSGAGIDRGEGCGKSRGIEGDRKENDDKLRSGGNGHSTGGSLEAWVKKSRTSAKSGLSFGFFARQRFTMFQAE